MAYTIPPGAREWRGDFKGTVQDGGGDVLGGLDIMSWTGSGGPTTLAGGLYFVNGGDSIDPISGRDADYKVPAGQELVVLHLAATPWDLYGKRAFRLLVDGVPAQGAGEMRMPDTVFNPDNGAYAYVSLHVLVPSGSRLTVEPGNTTNGAGVSTVAGVLRGYLRPTS